MGSRRAGEAGGAGALDPIEAWQARDARHVGQLYRSREEAAAARPGLDVKPTGPLPPRDQPHRRLLAVYRQVFTETRGLVPPVLTEDRWAASVLLELFGLDRAEQIVLREFGTGRGLTMRVLAVRAKLGAVG